AGDGVHALAAQLIGHTHIPGQVLSVARGREGARHGEQHHALALEQLIGTQVLRPALAHDLELALRHAITNLDAHGSISWDVKATTGAKMDAVGPGGLAAPAAQPPGGRRRDRKST